MIQSFQVTKKKKTFSDIFDRSNPLPLLSDLTGLDTRKEFAFTIHEYGDTEDYGEFYYDTGQQSILTVTKVGIFTDETDLEDLEEYIGRSLVLELFESREFRPVGSCVLGLMSGHPDTIPKPHSPNVTVTPTTSVSKTSVTAAATQVATPIDGHHDMNETSAGPSTHTMTDLTSELDNVNADSPNGILLSFILFFLMLCTGIGSFLVLRYLRNRNAKTVRRNAVED